jgi:hypothetical protein
VQIDKGFSGGGFREEDTEAKGKTRLRIDKKKKIQ